MSCYKKGGVTSLNKYKNHGHAHREHVHTARAYNDIHMYGSPAAVSQHSGAKTKMKLNYEWSGIMRTNTLEW